MQFTSELRLDDGVFEREFTLGEIPGTLWTPESAAPTPLVLMAHNNGLPKADSRLVARARYTAARGYAVATIDAAGCGARPRSAADEQARADLRRAMQAGEPVDEIFESFIGPLVEKAAPNGGPPWTPSLRCPRSTVRSVTRGGPPSAFGWRWPSHASRPPASSPEVTYPAPSARRPGRSPFHCCSCCSGTTKEPPAARPGPVRRLRHQGEDTARQPGRTHRHPVVRARGRGPLPRPTPEVTPGRQAGSRQ